MFFKSIYAVFLIFILFNSRPVLASAARSELWEMKEKIENGGRTTADTKTRCLSSTSEIEEKVTVVDRLFSCDGPGSKIPNVAIIDNYCTINGKSVEIRRTIIREKRKFLFRLEQYLSENRPLIYTVEGRLIGMCVQGEKGSE